MLTQRADANGRDTPSAGKVCWRLSALDRSERPIQEACDGLRHSGGSNSAWSTRSLRPIDPGEPTSNPMPSPPSRNDRPTYNGTATDRNGIGIDRNGSGTDRNGTATDRNGTATDRNGTATDRNGTATDRNGTATDRNGTATDRNGTETDRNGLGTGQNGSGPYRNGMGPTRPSVIDEDYPKPLYRDYSQQNGWSPPAPSRAAPRQESDPPTEETMSPIAFAPRRPRVKDDETTTICRVAGRQNTAPRLSTRSMTTKTISRRH